MIKVLPGYIDRYMPDKFEKSGQRKISINFPADLWKQLKVRAAQNDTTVTDILVRLSQEYLSKDKRKVRSR